MNYDAINSSLGVGLATSIKGALKPNFKVLKQNYGKSEKFISNCKFYKEIIG